MLVTGLPFVSSFYRSGLDLNQFQIILKSCCLFAFCLAFPLFDFNVNFVFFSFYGIFLSVWALNVVYDCVLRPVSAVSTLRVT